MSTTVRGRGKRLDAQQTRPSSPSRPRVGRFPGETSALSLIWAVLELSSRGWRGVVMTPRSVAEIERLRRRERSVAAEEVAAEEMAAAKHSHQAEATPALSPGHRDATF